MLVSMAEIHLEGRKRTMISYKLKIVCQFFCQFYDYFTVIAQRGPFSHILPHTCISNIGITNQYIVHTALYHS